jgi:PAS domain S-box-containing protein
VLDWILGAFTRITGFSEEDVDANKDFMEFIYPGDFPVVSRRIAALLAGQSDVSEFRILRRDGEVRWLRDHGQPAWDERQGRVTHIYGAARDITERKRTEQALRESEERYRYLIQAVTDYIYMVRVEDGRVVETIHGPGCVAVTGYTSEDFAADPFLWYRMVVPEDRTKVEEQAQQMLKGSETLAIEHRILRKDGTQRWVRNTSVPHRDERGKLLSYDGLVQDITERKLAEEALRESESKFRSFVEQSIEGFLLVDEQGIVIEWNRALEEMTGVKREQALGQFLWDIQLHFMVEEFKTPAAYEQSKTIVLQALQSGQAPFFNHPVEAVYRRSDGSRGIAQQVIFLVKTEGGFRIGSASRDITEQKRAEEARHRYAQRLEELREIDRAILEARSPEAITLAALKHLRNLLACQHVSVVTFDYDTQKATILAVDLDGKTQLGFQQQMTLDDFGITPDLLEGRVHIVDDIATLNEKVASDEQLLAEGIRSFASLPFMVEGKLIGSLNLGDASPNSFTPDRIEIAHEAATSLAIAIQQAQLREQVQHYTNELEQRVAERTEQLEAANKELEAFSYSVSHDLRAPLRAMDGFSRILLEEYAPHLSPDIVHYLDIIRENALQMGRLIDDLLAFSRLSRQPFKKQAVDNEELVHQAIESLEEEQKGRNINLSIGELPTCQGDPALLRQVWVNLLSNALKFTRRRGITQIEIGCLKKDSEQVYYVKDNGTGFDMQYTERLFGVFQRLHSAEEYEGSGVGLAIVQRVISRHGGRIWVEAEPDKGATFYFVI